MGKLQLYVYLFGRFRLEREEETLHLPTRKVELLLAYLALHPDPHSREKIAALFWGDVPDPSAKASLRNALSTLRRKLDDHLLLADRQTVQLNPAYPFWVDAQLFQTQATRFLNAPSPDPTVVDLELYTDDLLIDFYDDWVLVKREELRALYLNTLLELTQQLRSHSKYERALEFAEQVLAPDRANERAHQHMMFCYMALGNRGAALRQYEACRRALMDELAVEPSPATKRLYEWIQQASDEKIPVEASLTNLPIPLSSFVGRQREMAEVKQLLSSARLLTLTGAGGSGKTRLAIQVATDLLDAYRDGVWWVELAELADSELAPRAVAKALGVPELPNQTIIDSLVNFLHSRQLLLVLDNCEHLIETSARLVKQLLGECPHINILATSREMLGIAGEHVWPVPALSVPETDHPKAAERLEQYEAVRLFVGRAKEVNPDFTLSEANARPVAKICRRLEGLPLAIELAAARINMLPAEQIATRLEDSFRLLSAGSRTALPRHQTLRAAIDWSYDLLSEEEQTLLRRLSVFAGGWTLSAAEAVCTGQEIEAEAVFDILSRLVDKSLVETRSLRGKARFRMLQLIRQYSREQLLKSGETGKFRNHHLDYYLKLVEAANPHIGYFLSDQDNDLWQGRLEVEYDNLRAAIRWSALPENGQVEKGLRLAGNLHWFWFTRGRFSEGRVWLARLLDINAGVSLPVQAQAFLTAGYLDCWQGKFVSGRPSLEQALVLFQRLEDGSGISFALHGLGFVALGEGNIQLSHTLFTDSLREARDAGDRWLASFALHFLAIVVTYQGDYDTAVGYFEEGDAIIEEMGGPRQGLAFSRFHLARISRLQGDYPAAQAKNAEAMRLFQKSADRRGIGYVLSAFTILAAYQGDMQRAAQLSGAVASLQDVLGPFLEAPLQIEYDQELTVVRDALDEEAFTAALAAGRAMSIEQAIEYALEQDRRSST